MLAVPRRMLQWGVEWGSEGSFCPSPCPEEAVHRVRPVAPQYQEEDRKLNPSLEARGNTRPPKF